MSVAHVRLGLVFLVCGCIHVVLPATPVFEAEASGEDGLRNATVVETGAPEDEWARASRETNAGSRALKEHSEWLGEVFLADEECKRWTFIGNHLDREQDLADDGRRFDQFLFSIQGTVLVLLGPRILFQPALDLNAAHVSNIIEQQGLCGSISRIDESPFPDSVLVNGSVWFLSRDACESAHSLRIVARSAMPLCGVFPTSGLDGQGAIDQQVDHALGHRL